MTCALFVSNLTFTEPAVRVSDELLQKLQVILNLAARVVKEVRSYHPGASRTSLAVRPLLTWTQCVSGLLTGLAGDTVSGGRLCTGLVCGQQTALEISRHPEAGRLANTNCYWRQRMPRDFAVFCAVIWNSLPTDMRVSLLSAETFARHPKACLFRGPC